MPNKKARRNNNRKEKKPPPPPKLYTMRDQIARRVCLAGAHATGVHAHVDSIQMCVNKEKNEVVTKQLKLVKGELQWVMDTKPYYL